MFIYIFIGIFSFMLCVLYNKKSTYHGCVFLMCLLFSLCAFRDVSIGADTMHYVDNLHNGSYNNYKVEFLYYLITALAYTLNFSDFGYIFLFSLITYIPLIILLLRVDKRLLPFVLLMFICQSYFTETFSLIRQSAATTFIAWSFYFYSHRRYKPFLLTLIVAIGFHTSSLFVIPFIFLSKINYSYSFVFIAVILSAILSFSLRLVDSITTIFESLSTISLISGYSTYADNYDYTISFAGLCVSVIPRSVMCLVLHHNRRTSFYDNLFFGNVCLANIVAFFPIGYRIVYGLSISSLFSLPILINSNNNQKRILLLLYYLFIFALYCYGMYSLSLEKDSLSFLIPYKITDSL